MGKHTFKFGAQFHDDQVNEKPNATFNGTFSVFGTETGNYLADFLLGVPSNYTQSTGAPYYLRDHYFGIFGQDSWRVRRDLTLNIGLRWDVIRPWSEKYNNIQTQVPGSQSTLYPNAIPGLLVAGDPGIPSTLSPTKYGSFAPRIGLAYSPNFDHGVMRKIFGSSGKSSIRASYGIFYTAIPGLSAGIMYSVPPFGYNYLSPAPPLLATPFITAATGYNNGQRFPFPFPPHSVSASNPDNSINWANFAPLAADPFFYYRNRVPYINNYMFSVQRQITPGAVFTLSYVGNQGHRILAVASVNLGNPALCLSLPGCGPFGEDNTYTNSAGQTINGTRSGQNNYGPLVGTGEN